MLEYLVLPGREDIHAGWNHLIEPAWQMYLQFGLFSRPIRGPQLVHQRLLYVLS